MENTRSNKIFNKNISTEQKSIKRRVSLSLKRNRHKLNERISGSPNKNIITSKENKNVIKEKHLSEEDTIGFSAIEDLICKKNCDEHNLDKIVTCDKNADDNFNNSVELVFSCPEHFSINSESSDKTIIYNKSIEHKNNLEKSFIEIPELPEITIESNLNNSDKISPTKRKSNSVNLDAKKKKLGSTDIIIESKVLVLNTNVIDKPTHVNVKSQNCNIVKQNFHHNKSRRTLKDYFVAGHGKKIGDSNLEIDNVFVARDNCDDWSDVHKEVKSVHYDAQDMSKNSDKCEFTGRTCHRKNRNGSKSPSPHVSPLPREVKASFSEDRRASSSMSKRSAGSFSSRNVDPTQFNVPSKTKSNKTTIASNIPYYKIVAGTHFAVDAFSYGEIPNVKHYFLTHFHSDHYSGLRKSFSKLLFCSTITADLCVSRLGVNRKCINIINIDDTIKIEGVEITAVDANHCPGAIMLIFTLPNGKTMLHTGDFRATPTMETYPVFWNKDIHTVYLDTTYCNPRYDFPTQDQSLERAVYLLRLKKKSLEDSHKSFSKVLIVCGTYTIGKEKFFLGLARRVSCSVWACPEKDKVLQIVEARSFTQLPRQQCQLHVVPMRDLTIEKLRSYLDSLQGAFDEVVAFKPSGWENGKNSFVEKDSVTIHGIPYSEHSSFSELIRFIKFLKPKQVIPTVDISGGIKSVQKHFPCPLVNKEDINYQTKLTDYFTVLK